MQSYSSAFTITLLVTVSDLIGGKSLVDNMIPFSCSILMPTPSVSLIERGFSNITSPSTASESVVRKTKMDENV